MTHPDNSPMLHQDADLSPMLGGDRTPVMCNGCGSMCVRDFFGNAVCLECLAADMTLKDLQETAICPKCKHPDSLNAEIVEHYGDRPDEIIAVWCFDCEDYIWIYNGPFQDYTAQAYMSPGGGLEVWA